MHENSKLLLATVAFDFSSTTGPLTIVYSCGSVVPRKLPLLCTLLKPSYPQPRRITTRESLQYHPSVQQFTLYLGTHTMAAKVADAPQLYKHSMDEFFKVAKYPLVKHCDMTAEMKEEAVDVCITAVEKFPDEREKCTQVSC